jgi:hypothetical protein
MRRILLLAPLLLALAAAVAFPRGSAATLGSGQLHYHHLAAAWLEGRLDIPAATGIAELIPAADPSRANVPYPPAPALLAVPLAWLPMELAARLLALGALGALFALALLVARDLGIGPGGRLALAAGLGGASGLWFLGAVGSSWLAAQLVGLDFALAALLLAPRRPLLAGLFGALAIAARIPVGLGLAPLLLYRLAANRRARALPVALLGALPVLLLWGLDNLARFGSPLENGYALIPGVLSEPWFRDGISSLSYLPRGLEAALLRVPGRLDGAAVPDIGGMAVWIVAPATLAPLLAVRAARPSPRTLLALAALLLALLPGLTHGTWGFTQLGYRFAYDALPAGLFLAAAAAPSCRRGARRTALAALLVAGATVNLWAWLELAAGHWTLRGL